MQAAEANLQPSGAGPQAQGASSFRWPLRLHDGG